MRKDRATLGPLHFDVSAFSVKLRGNDTAPELAEPYFYYGQALLYLGLSEQQVFGSDIVKGRGEGVNVIGDGKYLPGIIV